MKTYQLLLSIVKEELLRDFRNEIIKHEHEMFLLLLAKEGCNSLRLKYWSLKLKSRVKD